MPTLHLKMMPVHLKSHGLSRHKLTWCLFHGTRVGFVTRIVRHLIVRLQALRYEKDVDAVYGVYVWLNFSFYLYNPHVFLKYVPKQQLLFFLIVRILLYVTDCLPFLSQTTRSL